MARLHWLAKSEPSAYAWEQLVADRVTRWDGVRNHQARNNLAAMQKGDLVLFYHSGESRAIVGVMRVARAAYPDPKADDARWLAVDVEALKPLAQPVSLAAIKADAALRGIALVKQSRLSVMPLEQDQFERILALGKTKL
jgi:predicted RNA-binding protein with PUA-like domain